jgi:hypothetical protein
MASKPPQAGADQAGAKPAIAEPRQHYLGGKRDQHIAPHHITFTRIQLESDQANLFAAAEARLTKKLHISARTADVRIAVEA